MFSTRLLILFSLLLIVALFQLTHLLATPSVPLHPIPHLMQHAELNFRRLISSQTNSLHAAVAEYKRRYHRDPPIGFDDWFAFAQDNNVKIIDEYDSMINELAPFWDLPGHEIRRRVLQVGQLPSIDLVRLENGKAITLNIPKRYNNSDDDTRARGFRVMIQKFQHKLPDMDFPINSKAEGRILIPWEHKMYPNTSKLDSSAGVESMLGGDFIPDWRGDGNVWEQFRRTCHPASQARRLFRSLRPNQSLNTRSPPPPIIIPSHPPLTFPERPDDSFDFCAHPNAHFQHGHFFSDWRTIPVLYPVFSPSKAPGFSDILIPSHYYYTPTPKYTYGWDPKNKVVKDVDDAEVPWSEKTDHIYWRGATTGGGSSPHGFLTSYQRHRFLDLSANATNTTRSVVFADPPGSTRFVTATVPLQTMNAEFMNTAFTKAVGCLAFRGGGCDGMKRHYRFSEPVPLGESWRHKYLVDIDGMGYSARLMALLASDSAVLKATVYREFFTDWIQPWLHYIPLSQSYTEIYNIHAFFSGASQSMLDAAKKHHHPSSISRIASTILAQRKTDGDRRLRRIARAGRQWKNTIARNVDMEAYVYRLCLEYARLWADDRDAMSYSAP